MYGSPKNEAHKKLFKEAEDILLSINQKGISRSEYDSIMKTLFALYLWDKKFDKAEKILNELKTNDDFLGDNDEFWFYLHKEDIEKANEKYYSILRKTLLNDVLFYGIPSDNLEKFIDISNKLIKVLEIFEEDLSNELSYWRIGILHESNAFMYAKFGKKDESLAELEKMTEIGDTSYESLMELVNNPERKEYELIKNTDGFKELAKKLKQK